MFRAEQEFLLRRIFNDIESVKKALKSEQRTETFID